MGNVLKGCIWFGVPRELVDGRHLATLRPSSISLLVLLFSLAQRHTAVQLEVPAYEVEDFAGLHSESVAIARRELEQAGFLKSSKGQGGVTVYQLLNPETKQPLPPPEGRRGVRKYIQQPGRSARTVRNQPRKEHSTAMIRPPTWDEIGAKVESGRGETVSAARKNRYTNTEFPSSSSSETYENNTFKSLACSLKTSSEKRSSASGAVGGGATKEERKNSHESQVQEKNSAASISDCVIHGPGCVTSALGFPACWSTVLRDPRGEPGEGTD